MPNLKGIHGVEMVPRLNPKWRPYSHLEFLLECHFWSRDHFRVAFCTVQNLSYKESIMGDISYFSQSKMASVCHFGIVKMSP